MQKTMGVVTSVILAAFAAYAAAFFFGVIEGNFALLLLLATTITGLYWVAEKFYFLPARRKATEQAAQDIQRRQEELARQGIARTDLSFDEGTRQKLLSQPWWLDWTAGLFPVIVAVFVLRSFLFEPFKIPSGSMIPTLRVGDLILVNKFYYGVRLPVINTKVIANHDPQRGDVMVFRYPPQPSLDYIKRVIGVPGDEVAYLNKRLTVNGQPVPRSNQPDFFDGEQMRYVKQFGEDLGGRRYNTLNDDMRPPFVTPMVEYSFRENCRYPAEGVVCKVPPGHYFMMGDNRDNSLDSRFWGFVPESNIVGKAFFVWMNFGDLGRIGSFE
ncbi:signal peptidase I [Hydrogenophaga sp. RWCD_12]|uniref:signal peptidase I n=1 Tax=Hydrogenophaga sp. RWCD_12 TaxID=3391190 RepID=UPI0039848E16